MTPPMGEAEPSQPEGLVGLTVEEWRVVRRVFLPANPRKLRSAHPDVREIAAKLIARIEALAAQQGAA